MVIHELDQHLDATQQPTLVARSLYITLTSSTNVEKEEITNGLSRRETTATGRSLWRGLHSDCAL